MNAVRPHLNRVREFFFEAIESADLEVDHFLTSRCADLRDDERSELLALLKAHESAGDFLGDPTSPGVNAAQAVAAPHLAALPQEVGPYRLIRKLGEGGFGSVYLAAQERPLRRQVALKLIKPGMDTAQVISRFNSERQALAMMDHPHIARVFDAGETDAGRPWFAMEYVAGPPITLYCRQENLTLGQKLSLFLSVCQGVQHAHQKAIIHRDLKPANVLVADQEGRPLPKVIDFGIAKALTGPLTDITLTAENQRAVGTPQYMSPEQAGGSADVDTRTDVYALGVLLFELLTGLSPFDAGELKRKPWDEQLRILREESPPRASSRLAKASPEEVEPLTAVQRDRLTRELRRDLDWIILRAMEKDPARRYATVENLVSDVQRYLAHEPVSAGPPAKAYRLKKFAVRHKRALAVTSLFAVILSVGATVATVGWIRAREERVARLQQEQIAEARLALADERQRRLELAEKSAQHSQNVVDSAQKTLTALFLPMKGETTGDKQANLQRLDSIVARMDQGHLKLPDELAGPLRSVVAFTYQGYEKYDLAASQAAHAVDIYRRMGPTVRHKLAEDLMQLANALSMLDRFDEAEPRIVEAVALYTDTDPLVSVARAPIAMLNHSLVKLYQGDEASARKILEAAISRVHSLPNADPGDETTILKSYIIALKNLGKMKEAEEFEQRLKKLQEKRTPPVQP